MTQPAWAVRHRKMYISIDHVLQPRHARPGRRERLITRVRQGGPSCLTFSLSAVTRVDEPDLLLDCRCPSMSSGGRRQRGPCRSMCAYATQTIPFSPSAPPNLAMAVHSALGGRRRAAQATEVNPFAASSRLCPHLPPPVAFPHPPPPTLHPRPCAPWAKQIYTDSSI